MRFLHFCTLAIVSSLSFSQSTLLAQPSSLVCQKLTCEYRVNPLGIDDLQPRLNWQVHSDRRGQTQSAYQILVSSSKEKLATDMGDLWDTGKVISGETIQIPYSGTALKSRMQCFWKVRSWNQADQASEWSAPASWSMGLLNSSDWKANYISVLDDSPVFKDRENHFLPPARHYRKPFVAEKKIKRATVYATALGIFDLEINGRRANDDYFSPGWTDYRQRAYYKTYDVTSLVKRGGNAIGATVADGWYSGYVGFGLLVGIGTEKIGRYTYGKTPALMMQLELEFEDGSMQQVVTDASWKVTSDGPIRQADLLMGEFYDARQELSDWSTFDYDDESWDPSILASQQGPQPAQFYEFKNPEPGSGPQIKPTPVDLRFVRPKLESFPGVPVVVTERIRPKKVTAREPGTYIFDLGQNFAGNIRLNLKGPAGHRVKIRYAEMLHPDGRMMTENLRRARATDFYVCRGDENGESYSPRFTFHGFQFVEVSNFPEVPTLDSIEGLVIHSDTPLTSQFECSDPMVNQLFKNVVWTQRANFLDLPTDCPQRDERMGWTGDAQAYVATAAYNADIGAFFSKWNRELMESQRPSGAFPGYAPFPFQHGWDFGSAWSDAGVICPWTIWQAYGDTRMIDRCWEPMTQFMQWRKRTSVGDLGITHGNAWGDWLSQGENTPLDYVDSVYYAISTRMMSEMAEATGRVEEGKMYRAQLERTKAAFVKKYVRNDGSIAVPTQTAHALALFADLVPESLREKTGQHLALMLKDNGNHMATGFLGTRPLLPVLTATGQNDLAVFLLQSHEFPSWGYEIDQGATSIWERWDSFTKEDGFGRHNAAMNSFSHYSFGAVCEWMFRSLAGIESDGAGYRSIIIHPHPPRPKSNAMHSPIDQVRSSYDSIRGKIQSNWTLRDGVFNLDVTIPANTTAKVFLPATNSDSILESGQSLAQHPHVKVLNAQPGQTVLEVASGRYAFSMQCSLQPSSDAIVTSPPKDKSINPEKIDLTDAKRVLHWDFRKQDDLKKWSTRNNLKVETRNGSTYLIATGNDPQISTTFADSITGQLVIELEAQLAKPAESQFFWCSSTGGFNAVEQSKRQLRASEKTNRYLFSVSSRSIGKLRFDPFSTFDEYANKGEMKIESISIYALPSEKNDPENAAVNPTDSDRKRFPNVLIFLAEDQGAHLSLLGTAGLKTPNIDRLASNGMYFKNAFVNYPVCSASKAAMYTGLFCHTNGILNNTHNFHKPANRVTEQERVLKLAQTNRIKSKYLTLPEILKANGFYQGVTHKLHVLPNEKFPFDRFMKESPAEVNSFFNQAQRKRQPWFLLVNVPYSHRPYPNSDKTPISVAPNQVQLPSYLPDTPVVRKDWAEYLSGVEKVDDVVGRTLKALEQTGDRDNTLIVYLSDHGPTYPHGKMTLYDLGLRVPMIFSGPGIETGITSELASEVDLLPTLLELLEKNANRPVVIPGSKTNNATSAIGQFPYALHGKSLAPLLTSSKKEVQANVSKINNYVFAEISNRGPLPNTGIQERSIFDGRWKLIYRENVDRAWRQVNADSRMLATWGNRTYEETLKRKNQFPEAYRVLQEMDPQKLGGSVPALELYDLDSDPDEMNNLAAVTEHAEEVARLMSALTQWCQQTRDESVTLSRQPATSQAR